MSTVKPGLIADKWLGMFAGDVAVWNLADLADLTDVFDLLTNVGEAVCGVYNRASVDPESIVGKWLEEELQRVDSQRQALVEHVKTRPPRTKDEYDAFCRILLQWEAQCEGNPLHTRTRVDELIALDPRTRGGAS